MTSKLEAVAFGYTTSGFEIPQLIVRADSPEELAALFRGLAAQGITAVKPDPAEMTGEKSEIITCVVRRVHVGKDGRETPVIDLYPSWQGEYGQFRFAGIYLNTPEQIAEFEAHSGLAVEKLPVYESQAPLQRNASRRHRTEIASKPFGARKLPDGVKEIDGKQQTVWKFAGYADVPVSAPAAGSSNGSAEFKAPPWWNEVLKVAIPKYYDGNQPHATNSVKKLLTDGTLKADMKANDVLTVLQGRWESEEADEQPRARQFDDIPF